MLSICSLIIRCRQIRTTSVQHFSPDTPQMTINFTLTPRQARQTTKSEVISKTTVPGRTFVAQRTASSNRIQLPRILNLPLRLCTSCTRSIHSCNSAPGALAGLFVEPSGYSGTICGFTTSGGRTSCLAGLDLINRLDVSYLLRSHCLLGAVVLCLDVRSYCLSQVVRVPTRIDMAVLIRWKFVRL
jgi:hypothetical protein